MNQIKLGYLSNNYDYARNVINKVDTCNYQRIVDIHRISGRLLLYLQQAKLFNNHDLITDVLFGFNDFNLSKVDLFHFVNNVSYGKTPWVSTFETVIPRFSPLMKNHENGIPGGDKKILKGLEAIANSSCKKIISLSECSCKLQERVLQSYPNYLTIVKDKMCVLHPPQVLFFDSAEEKQLPEQLTFIFVGGYFFQKGGMEILDTFIQVKTKLNVDIKLILVSKMRTDSVTHSGEKEYQTAMKLIQDNSEWIEHHNGLPNHDVINLMKSSHVGLLPTWADTYGYSVLEMQAAGCPVITTDVRALPEINNDNTGWLIKLPKDPTGEAQYQTEQARKELRETLRNQLEQIMYSIINNPDVIKRKANESLSNIRCNHSFDGYGGKLQQIYQEALA